VSKPCLGCLTPLPTGTPRWRTHCRDCFIRLKRLEENALRKQVAELHLQLRAYKALASTIDRALLTRIISLCHPDKHGNSETSNQVTARLLEIRNTLFEEPPE
jgi:hypothetical protein